MSPSVKSADERTIGDHPSPACYVDLEFWWVLAPQSRHLAHCEAVVHLDQTARKQVVWLYARARSCVQLPYDDVALYILCACKPNVP